jgi:RHS repeat-associated protein
MLPDEFMKNGTLNFIIGDHASTMLSTSLGSTSIVTDDEGTVISETKYKAWGEVRYESTTSPTEYTYTGQYSYVSDFGLHFYNARWYDSSLGRFTSSDSIIPLQSQGVQAWDRYAYVNNNPMRYTDPSGHCIGVITCSLTALGFLPNYQGIANVMFWTETDNAVVAAGISVQSQFFTGIIAGSGRGIAQLTSDEMKDFELEGSAFNPYVAVQGMEERIELALNNCRACVTETDNLIVAALALSSTHFIYQR